MGRVGSARKEEDILSAACLLLLVHTPGWEQARKETFGSPSADHSQKAEPQAEPCQGAGLSCRGRRGWGHTHVAVGVGRAKLN